MKNLMVYLLLFWIVLAEKMTVEVLAVGTFLSVAVYAFSKKSGLYRKHVRKTSLRRMRLWLLYGLTLLREVFAANFQVAKVVLSKELKVSPCMVTVKTRLKSDSYKVILANSITLTPGTLSVQLNNDKLLIHCLKREYAEGLEDSVFEKILLELER